MRTFLIICGGIVLWGASLGVARLLGSLMRSATLVFVGLWFVIAAANMLIGVFHAGYSFREELPIFLLIFLLPGVLAIFVDWKVR